MVENDNVENQEGYTTAADGDGNDLQAEEMNNQGTTFVKIMFQCH